jgi:carbonyl reductase 1
MDIDHWQIYKDKIIPAGIAFKGNIFGAKEARQTLDVNFVGTKNVCEAMLPLMVKGGRIVNVCSMVGKQKIIKSPTLLQRFQV